MIHSFWKRFSRHGPRISRAFTEVRAHPQASLSLATLFAPGVFLIALGVVAVLMPSLIIALLASFLVFLGLGFCVVAWKVVRWKRRIDQITSDLRASGMSPAGFQGTILFSGIPGHERQDSRSRGHTEIIEGDERAEKIKIILH